MQMNLGDSANSATSHISFARVETPENSKRKNELKLGCLVISSILEVAPLYSSWVWLNGINFSWQPFSYPRPCDTSPSGSMNVMSA